MATPVRLADLTTLRLGGPAPGLTEAHTADDVRRIVGDADRTGSGVLVLGGGSNLVVADAGIDVPVVRIAIRGIRVVPAGESALVTVGAGENWDEVVATLTAEGFGELAPLSGIPGSAGATPVQNVGAYGTEIAEVLESVTLFDRPSGRTFPVPASDLRLRYRSSTLRGTNAGVITDVTVRLTRGPVVVKYSELARTLGVTPGATAPAAAVREAVLGLRRAKGMVLDPDDPDTRSVGSFFTNPILTAAQLADVDRAIRERLGPDVSYPRYPVPDEPASAGLAVQGAPAKPGQATAASSAKLSAAWLIERAGFGKGFAGPGGRVAISSKHTLALVNRGGGTTAELLALAVQIRDGVHDAFGVGLEPEPMLIGVNWPG
ncbi:UDP-N-acetylmuramate dehydrogenase [Nakamurella sp.]|uniref:UDP-N-acetylmuramate dehydrogenase n=1 Tax=Nakamurella sp. TaxID=1869182 RepID=UPI00378520D3